MDADLVDLYAKFGLKIPQNVFNSAADLEFAQTDQKLLAFEVAVTKDDDPCEVYLGDYRAVDGRQLPHRIEVRYGNDAYGVLTVKEYKLAAQK